MRTQLASVLVEDQQAALLEQVSSFIMKRGTGTNFMTKAPWSPTSHYFQKEMRACPSFQFDPGVAGGWRFGDNGVLRVSMLA